MGSKRGGNPNTGDGAGPGKIFIGGLAKDTTFDTFEKYFEKYGEITDSVIMKDRQTGRPRGFGFITYADPSVVDTLIQQVHVINGKEVEIKRTIPKGSAPSDDFKTKKIFVGGIPPSLTEDGLKDFFSKYGKVVEHEIIRDHETKRSRGFGFVVFDSNQVVDKVLANGNMIDIEGTQVEIKKAEPKKGSNPAAVPAYGSGSRSHAYNDGFGGFDDTYSGFGSGSLGPPSYTALGGFRGRLGGYGGSYGGFGGSGYDGYLGESSFGHPSRLGGGYGGGGFGGGYGRGGYESYDLGLGGSYGVGRGLYGSRAGYGGSGRYHPYAR